MKHEKFDYVEFAAKDLEATKAFFQQAFNWKFTDYGETYTAFNNQGLNGGFYQAELYSRSERGSALMVFYSKDIDATMDKVVKAGGEIHRPTFDFPGGRRFHFVEPSGNEFAVWSDK